MQSSRTNTFNPSDYECPITKQTLRHPVRASDGKVYELQALHACIVQRHLLLSPLTRQRLTSVSMEIELKQQIDRLDLTESDRYENYDAAMMFEEIQTTLGKPDAAPFKFFSHPLLTPMGFAVGVVPNALLLAGLVYLAIELSNTPPQILLAVAGLVGSLIVTENLCTQAARRV